MSVARQAVDRLGTRFLDADVDGVLAEFARTGEVVYAGSETREVAVGRPALRQLLEELLARTERYSWRTTEVHEVAVGDTVLLVAEAELTVHVADPSVGWRPEERLPYRLSGVLVHEPGPEAGAWRWRLCQGSEPVEAGAA